MTKSFLTIILLLIFSVSIGKSEESEIVLNKKEYKLNELIKTIEKQSSYTFSYSRSIIPLKKSIKLKSSKYNLTVLLDEICKSMNLKYKILDKTIALKAIKKVTISGRIYDSMSGEILPGVVVRVDGYENAVISNYYGFYSITLPSGFQTVSYSCLGYRTDKKEVTVSDNKIIDIRLNEKSYEFDEIVVTASKDKDENRVKSTRMGTEIMKIDRIKSIPSFGGEKDVLKSLQMLPGVQVSNEGTNNLSVRGGSFDQNLILLDEAPVYNPSHTLGFVSAFNPDAISSVKIYKGAYPAKFGGRLSSVVDVRMREGDNQNYHVSGGIGTLASRMTVEGPIVKNRSSFIISGRYSYIGQVLNLLDEIGKEYRMEDLQTFDNDNDVKFYDFNVKFNTKLGKKDHLYISAFTGSDKVYLKVFDGNNELNYSNTTATARWNHIFNSKLFSNTTLVYSRYYYDNIYKDVGRDYSWIADMKNVELKSSYEYFHNSQLKYTFGVSAEYKDILPGKIKRHSNTTAIQDQRLDSNNSVDIALYAEQEYSISDKLKLNTGLRFSSFSVLGDATTYKYEDFSPVDSTTYSNGEIVNTYFAIEPRITASYNFNDDMSVKLSYNRNIQNLHLLNNSTIGTPTDIWHMSSKNIKPQTADMGSLGVFKTFGSGYNLSVEGYYKYMNNVIDFIDNADLQLNKHIESQILSGISKAYGIEFMARKNRGKLTGWLSYTYSNVQRKIDGINNNEWYYATYHKPHNLSLFTSYELSKKWSVSALFKYTTGGRATLPEGTFGYFGASFSYYTERNGYIMDDFHQLDLSVSYKPTAGKKRKWTSEWLLSVNNVYHRKNTFSIYTKPETWDMISSKAQKVWLYGITPTITYNFKF